MGHADRGIFLVTGIFGSAGPSMVARGQVSEGFGLWPHDRHLSPVHHLPSQEPTGLSKHALILQWEHYAFVLTLIQEISVFFTMFSVKRVGTSRSYRKLNGLSLPEAMLRDRGHSSFSQGLSETLQNARTGTSFKTVSAWRHTLQWRQSLGIAHGPRAFKVLCVTQQSWSSCDTSRLLISQGTRTHFMDNHSVCDQVVRSMFKHIKGPYNHRPHFFLLSMASPMVQSDQKNFIDTISRVLWE